MTQYEEIKEGEKGAWISIAAYLVLSSIKLIIGYIFLSGALVADGYNNVTDIIASIAVLIGLKISQKPPDEDHPYGHFRAETIAALVASFIMATVGIQVLIDAIGTMIRGEYHTPNILTAWVAIGAAIVMLAVYTYNNRLATKINNQALKAAAKDNLSDALVSIGAAVGIFGAQLNMPWLDPVAALIVGIIICKTAWEIFTTSTHALTDGIDEKVLTKLHNTVSSTKGVCEITDLKARVHGNNVLVEVSVQVDPELSLIESHTICDEIERRLFKKHNILNVNVHVEPLEQKNNNDEYNI
ncbi:cation diffusion facilitator family transporter [Paenibacillus endoradicis]|uniref:cation diffusion facilitator family transporter n=1 Tax=Paenibacillus endoradicis TaxID=2972487 RepID=UPI002158C171|nr:cation diffusion facilitator family transporter [Paenibacillus endoradicis]MCR8659539.1 cation diffusion facilitator family transporter [Paenibacillus endoradicis]